jgi:hypothetical protein
MVFGVMADDLVAAGYTAGDPGDSALRPRMSACDQASLEALAAEVGASFWPMASAW